MNTESSSVYFIQNTISFDINEAEINNKPRRYNIQVYRYKRFHNRLTDTIKN